jgi:hypothetical protein
MVLTRVQAQQRNREERVRGERWRLITLAVLILSSISLGAQTITSDGDLVVLSHYVSGFGIPCTNVAAVSVRHRDGAFKFSKYIPDCYYHGFAGDLLYDPSGLIHVAHEYSIISYDASFNRVSKWYFPPVSVGILSALDLAMDREGNLYALASEGSLYQGDIASTAFSLRTRVPVRTNFIATSTDFGVDGCILYYVEAARSSSGGQRAIKRYDVCRDVALPDLGVPLPPRACSLPKLRVAPDGSILLADCDALYRIAAGTLRSYAVPGQSGSDRGLAVSADGRTLWTVSNIDGNLVEVDIETGSILQGPFAAYGHAIAIYGVPRAAALVGMTAIPTLSPFWLGLLAVATAVVALFRLTRT